jgi:maltokinase
MTALGGVLRRLHEALAGVFGPPTIDGGVIAAQMLFRLDAACQQVAELAGLRAPLAKVLDLANQPITIQCVHGDFHLGQALISPTSWTIIDFEGEPLKTPAERAAPDAVWRDVAGLLRSLDYARHRHPQPDGDQALQWYPSSRQSFLQGYLGSNALPAATCTAYEVDKAIYELVYETRNRPAWAGIPRDAIRTAIAAP